MRGGEEGKLENIDYRGERTRRNHLERVCFSSAASHSVFTIQTTLVTCHNSDLCARFPFEMFMLLDDCTTIRDNNCIRVITCM